MEAACRQAERSVREPLLQRISGLEGALVEVRRSETPCHPADSRAARLSVRMLTRGRVCRCVSVCGLTSGTRKCSGLSKLPVSLPACTVTTSAVTQQRSVSCVHVCCSRAAACAGFCAVLMPR